MFKAEMRLDHIPLLLIFVFIAPTNSPFLIVRLAPPVDSEPAKKPSRERAGHQLQTVDCRCLRPDKTFGKAAVNSNGIDAGEREKSGKNTIKI
jgi:hypothetical protein